MVAQTTQSVFRYEPIRETARHRFMTGTGPIADCLLVGVQSARADIPLATPLRTLKSLTSLAS